LRPPYSIPKHKAHEFWKGLGYEIQSADVYKNLQRKKRLAVREVLQEEQSLSDVEESEPGKEENSEDQSPLTIKKQKINYEEEHLDKAEEILTPQFRMTDLRQKDEQQCER
jgi:hypothetical protein